MFITVIALIIPHPWHMGKHSEDHPSPTQTTQPGKAKPGRAAHRRRGLSKEEDPNSLGRLHTRQVVCVLKLGSEILL